MIDPSLIGGWVAALVGLGACLVTVSKAGPERRKIISDVEKAGVESARILSDTAVTLLQPSVEQIQFLRAELAQARTEITILRNELAAWRSGSAR